MASKSPVLEVPEHVLDYLGEHLTLTLATASPAGVPHAATFDVCQRRAHALLLGAPGLDARRSRSRRTRSSRSR